MGLIYLVDLLASLYESAEERRRNPSPHDERDTRVTKRVIVGALLFLVLVVGFTLALGRLSQ